MYYGDKPGDVLESITQDLKTRGLSLAKAAIELGFNNRQSLTNLFRRLKESNSYMNEKQAGRFIEKYGYSKDYLLHGWGPLKEEDIDVDEMVQSAVNNITFVPKEFLKSLTTDQMELLIMAASELIDATLLPDSINAWRGLINNDNKKYEEATRQTAKRLSLINAPFYYSGAFGHIFLHELSLAEQNKHSPN